MVTLSCAGRPLVGGPETLPVVADMRASLTLFKPSHSLLSRRAVPSGHYASGGDPLDASGRASGEIGTMWEASLTHLPDLIFRPPLFGDCFF